MHEIRIHGRGGQGAVMASAVLAKALVAEGLYTIAIPSFGFERRGAPVAAFLRSDKREIRAMTNIYNPDIIICIDPTVARVVDIFAGIQEGTTLVQATGKSVKDLAPPAKVTRAGLCDAVAIALEVFRRPITNSIMLGAFARTTGLVTLDTLRHAIEESEFRDAALAQNLTAVERGYNETHVHDLPQERT